MLLAVLSVFCVHAQSSEKESLVFTIVEEMPEFPGGEKAMLEYLSTIIYPQEAKEKGIEGIVYVRLMIQPDGSVDEVSIARGSDELLNQAALNHVKQMPAWQPGRQNGKAVKVQYIVPIKFGESASPAGKKKK